MTNSHIALGLLAISTLFGCSVSTVEEEGSSGSIESPASQDCAVVLCLAVACEPGFIAKTSPGQCCPSCVPNRTLHKGDCACSGGYMDASYCGQFGDPWTMKGGSCVWPARGGEGLTAEECASVGAKHSGDGSGSDIYNLGLSCSSIGGSSTGGDCTTKGCPTGQHCDVCKTTSGSAYVCLPDGSVC